MKKNRENIVILLLVGIWVALRLALANIIGSESAFTAGVFLNLLFLLLAVYWAMRDLYSPGRPEDGNFLIDIKHALKAGSKYAILVVGIMFVLYSSVFSDFLTGKINMQLEALKIELSNPENIERIKTEHPALADKSVDELLEMKHEQIEAFLSPHAQTLLSLVALMLMNVIYSVFIVIFFRKVLYAKGDFAKARNQDWER